jgi:peptidoglycan/LPS O-acetylase OafA/YrhL
VIAAAGAVTMILLSGMERNASHSLHLVAHGIHSFSYALTMWSLVFLTIGVFLRFCVSPNAVVRFIADSSYWMYLIHLPVVVWLQVAVAELPFHWSLKLAFISLTTIAVSLLTYDLFVRSTFIGRILNGRKRERVLPAWIRGFVRRFN